MGKIFSQKPKTPSGGGYGVGTPAATRPAEPVKTETTTGSGFGSFMKLAGAGLEAYGEVQAADQANAVGMYNQGVARAAAREAEAKTAFDVRRMAEESNRGISSMETAGGASGAVGGNLLAMAKQASEDELGMLMRSREGGIEAGRLRTEGKMAKWQGKMAQKQGYMKAAGTLLSGF